MRNGRLDVSLYFGEAVCNHLQPAEASALLARYPAQYRVRRRLPGGRIAAIEIVMPPPPPSDSPLAPTTLTLADMLANVGLPCTFSDNPRARHNDYLSRERIQAARDKVAEFRIPSWVDRLLKPAPSTA